MSEASGLHDVVERSGNVGGIETHWREAPSVGCPPVLYVHGVPTASWDWLPYLQRIGGIAPDLPGFGESAKPSDFDYSITGYERWLETFTQAVGLERFSLVVHDWGGLALALAQRFPERIDRLVLHTCVTLLPGYRWHWIALVWRTPILGELFMACSTKWGFRQISRQSNVTPGPLPDALIDRFWPDFDRQTRRAILRLYRSADPRCPRARGGTPQGPEVPSADPLAHQRPLCRTGVGTALRRRVGRTGAAGGNRARRALDVAGPARRDRDGSSVPANPCVTP